MIFFLEITIDRVHFAINLISLATELKIPKSKAPFRQYHHYVCSCWVTRIKYNKIYQMLHGKQNFHLWCSLMCTFIRKMCNFVYLTTDEVGNIFWHFFRILFIWYSPRGKDCNFRREWNCWRPKKQTTWIF